MKAANGNSDLGVGMARSKAAIAAAEALVNTSHLFEKCWDKIERQFGKEIQAPREIIWLNGPPGAGKGANIGFIQRIRGITRSITTSDLLAQHGPARLLMEQGALVNDETVGDALLGAIFEPDNDGSGIIVDGFPRTSMQVEFITHLYRKLQSLWRTHRHDETLSLRFPRCSFKVVVLYVDEPTSIERQMRRSKIAAMHNKKVAEAGAGNLKALRHTDLDVQKCKQRYDVFRTHYPALVKLQQIMPFSVIDATGSLEDCEAQIAYELRYQSSLDLAEDTYAYVTSIPLAREVVQSARQRLVQRLDDYCSLEHDDFVQVLQLIKTKTLPVLNKCSLAGFAMFQTREPVFARNPRTIEMFIDILTDRGFAVSHIPDERSVPYRVDLVTGDVHCHTVMTQRFRITFQHGGVRNVTEQQKEVSHKAVAAMENTLLTASVIPKHLDHSLSHVKRGPARVRASLGIPEPHTTKPKPSADVQQEAQAAGISTS